MNKTAATWVRFRRAILLGAAASAAIVFGHRSVAADHGVDHPMRVDPVMPVSPQVTTFHKDLKGLWMRALDRPEASLRMHALQAIPVARRLGMPGVEDFAAKAKQLMTDEKQGPVIQLAAAQALVALDTKTAAADLLALDRKGDLDVVLAIDPSLAAWKTSGAKELWIARITDPQTAEQVLRSALRSLGALADADAAEPVRTFIADSRRSIAIRITAAEALSGIAPATIAETAAPFAASAAMEDRLLAVTMLPANADPKTVAALVKLVQDPEPGVASIAVGKLITGAPDALAPLAEKLATHSDAVIRRHAVAVLHKHPQPANITTLAKLLGDLAPDVRTAAREALIDLDAQEPLRSLVRSAATEQLNHGNWRALEQAALVLGSVDEKIARDRLVELLRNEQWQVRIAAVVALRRLKIPDTLPLEFNRTQELAAQFASDTANKTKTRPSNEDMLIADQELAQLIQNLGLGNVQEADSFLRRFIPKHCGYGVETRVAAIWTLGHLHDAKPDSGLAQALIGRIQDADPMDMEQGDVRLMSVVSLARTRDPRAKTILGKLVSDPANALLRDIAEWGLAYLDGKPYAGPQPVQKSVPGWFLEPID